MGVLLTLVTILLLLWPVSFLRGTRFRVQNDSVPVGPDQYPLVGRVRSPPCVLFPQESCCWCPGAAAGAGAGPAGPPG